LTIVVAGDVCPTGLAHRRPDPARQDRLFAGVRESVAAADVAIVNLECPLTRRLSPIRKRGPHLWADPDFAGVLRSAGFAVASLANNHIRDMGDDGVRDTLDACARAGLMTVGAGMNLTESARPLVVERAGHRLAVLAMAEHEFSIASERTAGACPFDPLDCLRMVRAARQEADFVLVLYHGGNELYTLPSPRVVKTCRFLVDAGADAVVCHHAHVASGYELYHDSVIGYGTGNLLFPGSDRMPSGWFVGYMAKLTLCRQARTTVQLLPHRQNSDGPAVSQMDPEEAEAFLSAVSRLSRVISSQTQLASEWDKFCRSRRAEYLSLTLSLSYPELVLFQKGVWPFWRVPRRGLDGLLNLLTCEAHREVAMRILQDELVPKSDGSHLEPTDGTQTGVVA
jgi:poly-gamma-glutamate synthesis protein (capsule biosynthesis protein)